VWIDEDWCIGCTLCIKACPVDAIVGANKRMHTVIEAQCNGCELCIPVCPVDCILTENISGSATGWAAWGQTQADTSRQRYLVRKARLVREADQREKRHLQALESKAENLSAHSQITDPTMLDKKKSLIEQALARARAKAGQK
jgi:Na+-translocating ferredoxin:NAD+ oxidoreductase subunit B